MSVEIGHIRPLPQGQSNPLVDAVEAQRSGALRHLLKQAIQSKSVKHQAKLNESIPSGAVLHASAIRPVAELQISSAEQAASFSLKGRELDDEKLIRKFRDQFKSLTTGDEKFLELCIHSLIAATEQHTTSIIDELGTVSPDQKTALKFLLLQITLLDAERYAIGPETLSQIKIKRDQILAAHNQSLDDFLITMAVTTMASGPLKIGHRQLMAANRMLSKNEDLGSLEIYGFLSRLIASDPNRLLAKLKVLREQWLLLSDRERTQYPLELTAQRQHFIQSRIRQIDLISTSVADLDRIRTVCLKAGVEKVPESAKVLLELVGLSGSAGVGSANKLSRLFESMSPVVKGTQIYCMNLRGFIQRGMIFLGRQNEKTFSQLVLQINSALKSSYHTKPADAEVK